MGVTERQRRYQKNVGDADAIRQTMNKRQRKR